MYQDKELNVQYLSMFLYFSSAPPKHPASQDEILKRRMLRPSATQWYSQQITASTVHENLEELQIMEKLQKESGWHLALINKLFVYSVF